MNRGFVNSVHMDALPRLICDFCPELEFKIKTEVKESSVSETTTIKMLKAINQCKANLRLQHTLRPA